MTENQSETAPGTKTSGPLGPRRTFLRRLFAVIGGVVLWKASSSAPVTIGATLN